LLRADSTHSGHTVGDLITDKLNKISISELMLIGAAVTGTGLQWIHLSSVMKTVQHSNKNKGEDMW
jgi:hypothetical protein